jgi:hypothetical protein
MLINTVNSEVFKGGKKPTDEILERLNVVNREIMALTCPKVSNNA